MKREFGSKNHVSKSEKIYSSVKGQNAKSLRERSTVQNTASGREKSKQWVGRKTKKCEESQKQKEYSDAKPKTYKKKDFIGLLQRFRKKKPNKAQNSEFKSELTMRDLPGTANRLGKVGHEDMQRIKNLFNESIGLSFKSKNSYSQTADSKSVVTASRHSSRQANSRSRNQCARHRRRENPNEANEATGPRRDANLKMKQCPKLKYREPNRQKNDDGIGWRNRISLIPKRTMTDDLFKSDSEPDLDFLDFENRFVKKKGDAMKKEGEGHRHNLRILGELESQQKEAEKTRINDKKAKVNYFKRSLFKQESSLILDSESEEVYLMDDIGNYQNERTPEVARMSSLGVISPSNVENGMKKTKSIFQENQLKAMIEEKATRDQTLNSRDCILTSQSNRTLDSLFRKQKFYLMPTPKSSKEQSRDINFVNKRDAGSKKGQCGETGRASGQNAGEVKGQSMHLIAAQSKKPKKMRLRFRQKPQTNTTRSHSVNQIERVETKTQTDSLNANENELFTPKYIRKNMFVSAKYLEDRNEEKASESIKIKKIFGLKNKSTGTRNEFKSEDVLGKIIKENREMGEQTIEKVLNFESKNLENWKELLKEFAVEKRQQTKSTIHSKRRNLVEKDVQPKFKSMERKVYKEDMSQLTQEINTLKSVLDNMQTKQNESDKKENLMINEDHLRSKTCQIQKHKPKKRMLRKKIQTRKANHQYKKNASGKSRGNPIIRKLKIGRMGELHFLEKLNKVLNNELRMAKKLVVFLEKDNKKHLGTIKKLREVNLKNNRVVNRLRSKVSTLEEEIMGLKIKNKELKALKNTEIPEFRISKASEHSENYLSRVNLKSIDNFPNIMYTKSFSELSDDFELKNSFLESIRNQNIHSPQNCNETEFLKGKGQFIFHKSNSSARRILNEKNLKAKDAFQIKKKSLKMILEGLRNESDSEDEVSEYSFLNSIYKSSNEKIK